MCKLISPLPHSHFHLLSKTDFFLAMILVINRAENFSREENNSFVKHLTILPNTLYTQEENLFQFLKIYQLSIFYFRKLNSLIFANYYLLLRARCTMWKLYAKFIFFLLFFFTGQICCFVAYFLFWPSL